MYFTFNNNETDGVKTKYIWVEYSNEVINATSKALKRTQSGF